MFACRKFANTRGGLRGEKFSFRVPGAVIVSMLQLHNRGRSSRKGDGERTVFARVNGLPCARPFSIMLDFGSAQRYTGSARDVARGLGEGNGFGLGKISACVEGDVCRPRAITVLLVNESYAEVFAEMNLPRLPKSNALIP